MKPGEVSNFGFASSKRLVNPDQDRSKKLKRTTDPLVVELTREDNPLTILVTIPVTEPSISLATSLTSTASVSITFALRAGSGRSSAVISNGKSYVRGEKKELAQRRRRRMRRLDSL
jgi:hypothetical protein